MSTCPLCKGSGRVRVVDLVAGSSVVQGCDYCAGTGQVSPAALKTPPVRSRVVLKVTNPGDPGYAEARARVEESPA